jgi:glycosyltransferase involved in cell wall biosynthesis
MQEKKTVLIYRNELLPLSETFIKEQILALREWRAVLVGRRLLNQLPLDNLDVRIVGPEHSTFPSRLLSEANRMLRIVPTHIRSALEAEQASLVHAHFGTDALDAWPLARTLNLPLLVTLHGYDINIRREWWEAGNAGTGMRRYPQRLLQLARLPDVGFIAVSEAIRRRAIEFGIPAEKIAVNYIGIDTGKFTPGTIPIEKRLPRVLFVGRLVEKKGCRYLIEAMSTVQKNVSGARVIVVGGGPLRQDLELFARGLSVDVEFHGAQTSAYVKRELDAARAFCLPSVTDENGDAEGFGLVLLEAQASGVPVVTSARGGATEGILDGVTGFSFAERDVRMLAERLTSLLKGDNILVQMAEQSSQYVSREFNLINCARRLEVLYNDFCLSAMPPKGKP